MSLKRCGFTCELAAAFCGSEVKGAGQRTQQHLGSKTSQERSCTLMRGTFFFIIAISCVSVLTVLTHYWDFNPYADLVLEHKTIFYANYYIEEPPTNNKVVVDVGSTAVMKIRERKLHKLYWTSVHGSSEAEAYHFVSAYLDDRRFVRGRPAIVVVGYFSRTAKPTNLYCLLKYLSGRTRCLKRLATQTKANCDSVVDEKKSKPMLYICHMSGIGGVKVELPVSVMISNVSNCDLSHTSGEIPVGNLDHVRQNKISYHKPGKKFGVFIGGPLIQKENVIQNLTNFIQMSQLLGAEFFTMYISPEQMDNHVIEFLLNTYPDVVRIIEWKKFDIHYPLHYYGQLVLISDCLYRSMYEVEYLVMMDLDEMIFPTRHTNWAELVDALEKKGKYASFMFLNRFFMGPPHHTSNLTLPHNNRSDPSLDPKVIQAFKGNEIPAYFSRTREVKCYFSYGAKTKLIIKPLNLVRLTVHESCESVRFYRPVYWVPPEVGISAHYRESSIQECVSKPTKENTIAIRFAKGYAERFHP